MLRAPRAGDPGPDFLLAMLECRQPAPAHPMTYILDLGLWHVGPFPTHVAAQHWAETHGCDDYRMIPLDDPAEAPARIHRLRSSDLQLQQG